MLFLLKSLSYTPDASFSEYICYIFVVLVFVRSFSYTPFANFSEESLTRLMVDPVRCFSYIAMLIIVRSFSYRHFACWIGENFLFLSYSPRAGFRQDVRFSYTIIVRTTQMRSQMLCLDQTKTQEQGLTGYSSVRLTSRASHRLGKCRLSWV